MNKKLYVAMTDKYLSGWGMSKNKINKYVVECDNWDQADQIEIAANKRSDMEHVNVFIDRPNYDGSLYLVSDVHYNDLGTIWTDGKYKTDEERED